MKILLQKIFNPKWLIINTFYGITHSDGVQKNIFYIQYSEIRNEYRLSCDSEYQISLDPAYHAALTKLAEYNRLKVERKVLGDYNRSLLDKAKEYKNNNS